MQLSCEAITSFQNIYQKKCGIKLNFEEAKSMALEKLKQFALIYKPIPLEDKKILNEFNSERNNN